MKPNIVLITVDCWRSDHIGKAHDAKVATPNIDKLADQSHYFTNAQSCGGWTKIAMTTLFSSTYASMFGFTKGKLSDDRPLLSEELARNGYHTAGFTTNIVCGSPQGFNRGFQTFEDVKPENTANKFKINKVRGFQRLSKFPLFHSILSLMGIDSSPTYPSLPADELVDRALHWLDHEHDKERPYFLWLHFMDLHMPYRSSLRAKTGEVISMMWRDRSLWSLIKKSRGTYRSSEERSRQWKQLYAEETGFLDQQLGRLFAQLQTQPDWQNSAMCLTADHGEEFYEHGTWGHSWNQLYDEGIRVPLTLRLPNQAHGNTINDSISHLDITPTLLDIAGVARPDKMLGKSWLPALQAESSVPKAHESPSPIISEMHSHMNSYQFRLSITDENHKYIYDGDTDSCLLFELESDPDAHNNLYSKDHPLASKFDRLRLTHIAKGALAALKGNVHLGGDAISYDLDDDPAVLDRLRALGYLE